MYTPDGKDIVMSCNIAPAQSAGSPLPIVVATDTTLLLCYETAPENAEIAAVGFARPIAHYFGSPNDEALAGHPLASKGLSSWMRSLSDMNRVHCRHDPNRYASFDTSSSRSTTRHLKSSLTACNHRGASVVGVASAPEPHPGQIPSFANAGIR
jgi:hypothetical protein